MNRDSFAYVCKTWLLVLFMFGVGRVSQYFPAFAVILACLILSAPNTTALIYFAVLNKTVMQKRYVPGSFLSRLNNRKFFCIIVSVFISLVTTFLMFLEISTWQWWDWIAVALLVPVFYFGHWKIRKFLSTQLVGLYLETYTMAWCAVIVPIVMITIYFVCDNLIIPHDQYGNILDAIYYYRYKNVLNQSPSVLVNDISQITSMVNAFRDYIITGISGPFPVINAIWSILIYAAIFFNITSILMFFIIPLNQLKRIYVPLCIDLTLKGDEPLQKGYIFLTAFLCLASIALFIVLENAGAALHEAGHFTFVQEFVEERIKIFSLLYVR